MKPLTLAAGLPLMFAASVAWGAASAVPPGPDHQVVEVLPQVTTVRPALRAASTPITTPRAPEQAARLAREAIDTARRTGDARYWGRAQTALGAWWDHPSAPPDLMVLQATVLQGQHRFADAQTRLQQALQAAPSHAQAWLTLASLYKLDGRYAQAQDACAKVAATGAALYGRICITELRSLQGASVGAAWEALQAQVRAEHPAIESWLLSLWGEHLERQGQTAQALQRYRESLALEADPYTALAKADLLLRLGRGPEALTVLSAAPDTDAVLLRRARAHRMTNQPEWKTLRAELLNRQQAQERRGEQLDAHAREYALTALWLLDDAAQAQRWAQRNLALQKEPVDWRLALDVARQAGDRKGFFQLRARLEVSGLIDKSLPKEWTDVL